MQQVRHIDVQQFAFPINAVIKEKSMDELKPFICEICGSKFEPPQGGICEICKKSLCDKHIVHLMIKGRGGVYVCEEHHKTNYPDSLNVKKYKMTDKDYFKSIPWIVLGLSLFFGLFYGIYWVLKLISK
jgi:hypothetical protein